MANEPVSFLVSGQPIPTAPRPAVLSRGQIKSAARIGARRGGGEAVRLEAKPGDDIVLLHIANGPTLYLHPEDARELLRAQQGGQPTRGANAAAADVIVPAQLAWRGLNDETGEPAARGRIKDFIGSVVLDSIEIITGFFKDKAASIAAAAVTRKVDGQVDPGVYALSRHELTPLKGVGRKLARVPASDEPMLMLAHGTFSNTAGTFGKLWSQHPGRVATLFERYGDRVYGLDHETLGVSPLGNALMLVKTLPRGARLHMLTHSRGGIVAEVLARLCGGRGVLEGDLAPFAGDGYAQHRAELEELAREVQRKQIRIERVVRVACPARGTLLASRRLDAYLSVLKWSMELAGTVVLPQLVDFLAEVARRRTDPAELPGLEAMMPGRPMAEWLGAPGEVVGGDLRVVAGDLEGDSVMTWLKTLLSDAFYWTDNDLVVQTRSMYGGTPRAEGAASFVLDRGAKVSHFAYFSNERTASLLTSALLDDHPEHFRPIGPLSWAGEDASGTRAARAVARSRPRNVAERPVVFVLPGILGSHLRVNGKRIWLSARFISGLEKLKWDAASAGRTVPDGLIGKSYDDLLDYLADSHEVIPFSFDWRRPIEDEAIRLAEEVEKALVVRHATQQPVRIIAHSMGGLVVRTMRLERPETWKRFASRPGARFLMLGTPNGGSFAPMQVLSGDDSFGNLFTTIGGLFDGHTARQLVAEMPGLLQLQAGLLDSALDLGNAAAWQALEDADLEKVRKRVKERSFWHRDARQILAMKWGVPTQDVLDRAVDLRKRLDAERGELEPATTLLVVGTAPATPATVKVTDEGPVVYMNTAHGDGRVTLDNAMLPGVRTWQVDVVHGELADARKAFDAYRELLEHGDTQKLPSVAAAVRRGAAGEPREELLVPSRPARTMRADAPPSTIEDVFVSGAVPEWPSPPASGRLEVSVVNGNLKFVRQPLLVGHYRSLLLTGSEWVIDELIGKTMSESLRTGLYPSEVGLAHVFANAYRNPRNPFAMPRPQASIVVGLGEEGMLRMSELVETIRQGALAYAQRLAEREGLVPTTFELAATLIGSGGVEMSPATSAQALALGVSEANLLLTRVGWPIVARLQLIELYLDRATEAVDALKSLADRTRGFEVEPFISIGQGALPRPLDAGYRGSAGDFISVRRTTANGSSEFEFTLSTRRARDEVRGTITQSKLLDQLVSAGANDENDDPQIGRALFKLLVPLEIEPFLGGSASLQLQLDPATAAYPWELLDLDYGERERDRGTLPWAIRSRLLRKLRIEQFREKPRMAETSTGVLVIGEPQCPTDIYPRLPGAVKEAREVASVFPGVEPILNEEALAITKAMLNRSFAILHVAGHGDIVEGIGGIVLSNGAFFGPREIESMRVVPQLAFINCCYLGRFDDSTKQQRRVPSRPQFAANVAEQLIKIGVRCIVAAGWAVDDEPAKAFAGAFYRQIARGQRFVDAAAHARSVTFEQFPNSNTWAAYQCYGDPDWTYDGATTTAVRRIEVPEVESADALKLHLETMVVKHKFDAAADGMVRERLDYFANLARGRWDQRGDVAAAFGAAYGEIGDFARAIDWYRHASEAPDGAASLKALEQLGNFCARLGEKARDREEILDAIALLERVRNLGPTLEREALLGSAYKRLAGVETSGAARDRALRKSLGYYRAAEALGRQSGSDELFYPAMNRMNLELRLRVGGGRSGFAAEDLSAVRQSLLRKNTIDPDFWSAIAPIELSIYEAVALRQLAPALDGILLELGDVVRRARSSREWDSVTYQIRFTLERYLETQGLSAVERKAVEELTAALPSQDRTPPRKPSPASKKKPRRKKRARRS